MTAIDKLTEVEILALTIYGEARGESLDGKAAVANVIINRSVARQLSIKKVCLQPKQFSCWNEDDANYEQLVRLAEKITTTFHIDVPVFYECQWIGQGVHLSKIRDLTRGATHYLTKDAYEKRSQNHWSNKLPVICVIGNHVFLQ